MARKDGGPPRGIVDQGGPRKELFTIPEHGPVVPVNVASRAPISKANAIESEIEACFEDAGDGDESYAAVETPTRELLRWEREEKPSFGDAAVAACILRRLGNAAGKEVYTVAFDFKYFFHCLAYHKSELWKCGSKHAAK